MFVLVFAPNVGGFTYLPSLITGVLALVTIPNSYKPGRPTKLTRSLRLLDRQLGIEVAWRV